jgi:hypothetical protein
MKRLTVTKIKLGPYIKWALISYFVVGVMTGTAQAFVSYLTFGADALNRLFWTYATLPFVYLATGVVGSTVFIFLYNVFNRSLGSYVIEVNKTTLIDQAPPPPPTIYSDEISLENAVN